MRGVRHWIESLNEGILNIWRREIFSQVLFLRVINYFFSSKYLKIKVIISSSISKAINIKAFYKNGRIKLCFTSLKLNSLTHTQTHTHIHTIESTFALFKTDQLCILFEIAHKFASNYFSTRKIEFYCNKIFTSCSTPTWQGFKGAYNHHHHHCHHCHHHYCHQ